ncbi:DUF6344 domain-containing protein [Streptomyces sp. SPB074]|uniref:DUF6344 domain-containing protein n=1 Tax=Streptomyces sp. (strain SPB074) TaxID=465543 RepID=UPI0001D1E392|nr:DUF6344 domain-containing protein [Streptomyces sp. SPB074]EDY46763.2 conserved hypothetical protein [Streptomyces sp. SPB074]
MAAQTFSTLWKALVGAFLALFAFLGLAAAPAQAAAAPATPAPQPRDLPCAEDAPRDLAVAPALFGPPLAQGRSLPPTMKQRIRAEQHGSSPSCRQLLIPLDHPYDTGAVPARGSLAAPRTTAATATRAVAPGTESTTPRNATTESTTAETATSGSPEQRTGTAAHPLPAVEPAPATDPAPLAPGIPAPAGAPDTALPHASEAPFTLPGIPAAREHHDSAAAPLPTPAR